MYNGLRAIAGESRWVKAVVDDVGGGCRSGWSFWT